MAYAYSIVFPTTAKNEKYLIPCLESCREHSGGKIEIIVILNGEDQPASKAMAEELADRVIELKDPVGYSAACNIGLVAAQGKYKVICNDDVLFTPDWNVELMRCLTKAQEEFPEGPPPGIVGPSSNNVAGVQQIPKPQGITPDNYLDFWEKASKEHNQTHNWVPSLFLSGYCMMFSQDYLDTCDNQPFDERLVNGAEDNLVVIDALVKGFASVACGNAFIFHFGSVTTDRLEEDNARGVKNLFDFYDYGAELFTEDQAVAACCRARLLTDEHIRIFLMAVQKNASIADHIVLLDDRSEPGFWPSGELAVISEDTGTPFHVHHNPEHGELNECQDRQWLLDKARELVGNVNGWYLSFDADEVWEDKFDRTLMQKLIHPAHPGVMGYIVHFYTFWDEAATFWRSDDAFGHMAGHRLIRILPEHNMQVTKSGMHMGNVPLARVIAFGQDTSIRVKHYGFTTQEERRRKFDFYTEHDKVVDQEEVGHENYNHLIQQQVMLQEWVEDTSLTIGTVVLNEEIKLHDMLRSFGMFADEMIFVDTGSTDRTVALLEKFGCTVINYEEATGQKWDPTFATEGGDLGRARNLGLRACKTFWFWQIDPDEHPRANDIVQHPLSYMRRQLDRTQLDGMNFFFRCITPDGHHTVSQTMRLISKPQERVYFGCVHETLDKHMPDDAIVDYSKLDFVHTGALLEPAPYKEKMKRYFRGNLRMIQEFPDEGKGWFNAAQHFLDSTDPGMRSVGIMFIHQAVIRNPQMQVARKELCVQGFTDMQEQLELLLSLTPQGHPFYNYGVEALQACFKFGLENRDMIRSPEHAEEVLEEPQWKDFLEMVEEMRSKYEPGGEYGTGEVDGELSEQLDGVSEEAGERDLGDLRS